ncbi:hypothetical protein FB45DRAFT_1019898 [Roridomyces roridus]|uniref:Uncharacterized protein n=1 Tax=Roridomyces roridus TaxID=1738132 RepID=A0AAD7FZI4_9AGAR|nr:hypothetical protein FB45DRAFT_1019898 [Roridomyces roridus]
MLILPALATLVLLSSIRAAPLPPSTPHPDTPLSWPHVEDLMRRVPDAPLSALATLESGPGWAAVVPIRPHPQHLPLNKLNP